MHMYIEFWFKVSKKASQICRDHYNLALNGKRLNGKVFFYSSASPPTHLDNKVSKVLPQKLRRAKAWNLEPETWNLEPRGTYSKTTTHLAEALPLQISKSGGLDHHTLNWLECIRSRRQPNCTIEMGRDSAINAQLGNIAYRSGAKVYWDKSVHTIANNAKAEQMTKALYRAPWKLPKV